MTLTKQMLALAKCEKCFRRGRYDGRCGYHLRDKNATAGCLDGQGYRVVYVAGRRVREHRLVMERLLGRPLLAAEHVHHRDGNKANNSPANLQLLTLSEHSRLTTRALGLVPPLVTKRDLIPRGWAARKRSSRT